MASAGLIAALGYALSSLLIVYLNKFVFLVLRFPHPCTLTCISQLHVLLFLWALRKAGAISLRRPTAAQFRRLLPVCACGAANTVLGVASLLALSVPMMTVLRKLTAAMILATDYVVRGKRESASVTGSVALMTAGAIIAGSADLNFNLAGYVLVFLNNGFTSLYLVLMKRAGEGDDSVGPLEIMMYNAMLGAPAALLAAALTGELPVALPLLQVASARQLLVIGPVNGAMGFVINYFVNWCTQANSPLTTAVTGQAKNVVTTIIGFWAFGEYRYSLTNVLGIGVVYCGSTVYAVARFKEKQQSELPVNSHNP